MFKEKLSSGLELEKMPEEHRKRWQESKEILIMRALGACARIAESYRGFYVGCSMLSYNDKIKDYFLDQSGNYKPVKKPVAKEKRCAERNVLMHAEINGDKEIVGMVVASANTQPDIEMGIKSDFLYPCKDCRQMLAESSLIKPWTRLILLKLNNKIDKMDGAEFYETLDRIRQTKKTDELVEASREMSYAEFIKKVSERKI